MRKVPGSTWATVSQSAIAGSTVGMAALELPGRYSTPPSRGCCARASAARFIAADTMRLAASAASSVVPGGRH